MSLLGVIFGWLRARRVAGEGLPETAQAEETIGEGVVDLGVTDTLDLHMFRPADVPSVVQEFLNTAFGAGIRQVRIVHGKGIGVQRRIVREILANDSRVSWFADAPDASGWGATVATLCGRAGEVHRSEGLPKGNR